MFEIFKVENERLVSPQKSEHEHREICLTKELAIKDLEYYLTSEPKIVSTNSVSGGDPHKTKYVILDLLNNTYVTYEAKYSY